jgi:putative restriction endonuclease
VTAWWSRRSLDGGHVTARRSGSDAFDRPRQEPLTASLPDRTKLASRIQGISASTDAGPYAEAAHVRPPGRPHAGPDSPDEPADLLCLCPSRHVLLDDGGFAVADDPNLVGLSGRLTEPPRHAVGRGHLACHRAIWGR